MMKRFNKKFAPLFIVGTAVFVLGTAFKYIFLTDHSTEESDQKGEDSSKSHDESESKKTKSDTISDL